MFWKRKRVALALGAGGARGIAHIGVLRVLEEASVPLDLVVGASIGALVGGAYAAGISPGGIEARLVEFVGGDIFRESALRSIRTFEAEKSLTLSQKIQGFFMTRLHLAQAMFRAGMLEGERYREMIDFFLPDVEIQDMPRPFRAVAVDLVRGRPVVFSTGSLRLAVAASCAVPGAVPPVAHQGLLLADGGIAEMVPTLTARREGGDIVVGVTVNADLERMDRISSAVDVFVRSTHLGAFFNERVLCGAADVVVEPAVGHHHWTDFTLAEELVRAGEAATLRCLPALRQALPLTRRWRMRRPPREKRAPREPGPPGPPGTEPSGLPDGPAEPLPPD